MINVFFRTKIFFESEFKCAFTCKDDPITVTAAVSVAFQFNFLNKNGLENDK